MIRTPSEAWTLAEVESLQVTGDLFGHSHCFIHDQRIVTVKVPEVELDSDNQPVPEHRDRAHLSQGHVSDKRLERTAFSIAWLEISVAVTEQISLPETMLQIPPKRSELAGPKLTSRLDRLIIDYEARLAAVLVRWEQTVRWLSGSSALGAPSSKTSRASQDRLQHTAFRRTSDGHRFWLPTHGYMSLRRTTIDAFLWEEIGKVLANGQSAPIWFQYIDEAYVREVNRDLDGAILSCAIACEIIARNVFWIKSGATQDDDARDIMDRLSISGILRKWGRLTGLPDEKSQVKRVERIFRLRNRLMHAGGAGTTISEGDVHALVDGARSFIKTGDEWFFSEQQLANPRCTVARHREADVQANAWLM